MIHQPHTSDPSTVVPYILIATVVVFAAYKLGQGHERSRALMLMYRYIFSKPAINQVDIAGYITGIAEGEVYDVSAEELARMRREARAAFDNDSDTDETEEEE